jgi:hypothetical protein
MTVHTGAVVFAALAIALATGCATSPAVAPFGANENASQPAATTQTLHGRPGPHATPGDGRILRVGLGAPATARLLRGQGTLLVSETFANSSTPANAWFHAQPACLTAGTSQTPKTSIPACGSLAPQDPDGSGALQLTQGQASDIRGLAGYREFLSTAQGLEVQFTLYVFDGNGADGSLLYFTDASRPVPDKPAASGGCLGYFPKPADCYGENVNRKLSGAYLGIGFDEFGNFSNFSLGGPGVVPETVAVCGAAKTKYHYLGGVTNAQGQPASLPFDLNSDQITRPANAPTIDVRLSRAGLLEVAIDIHDGQGFVTYLSLDSVGLHGQPRVPANVYVGFIGSNGGQYDVHQIGGLTISTLN